MSTDLRKNLPEPNITAETVVKLKSLTFFRNKTDKVSKDIKKPSFLNLKTISNIAAAAASAVNIGNGNGADVGNGTDMANSTDSTDSTNRTNRTNHTNRTNCTKSTTTVPPLGSAKLTPLSASFSSTVTPALISNTKPAAPKQRLPIKFTIADGGSKFYLKKALKEYQKGKGILEIYQTKTTHNPIVPKTPIQRVASTTTTTTTTATARIATPISSKFQEFEIPIFFDQTTNSAFRGAEVMSPVNGHHEYSIKLSQLLSQQPSSEYAILEKFLISWIFF